MKLGRKICCNYKKDVRCLMLVGGEKLCVLDETEEEQFNENHQFHFVFCPLLPEVERVECLASFKSLGFSIVKSYLGKWVS